LEVFRAKSEAFDLVISDMIMPTMTGDRLVLGGEIDPAGYCGHHMHQLQ
jgi:hypothetical protein